MKKLIVLLLLITFIRLSYSFQFTRLIDAPMSGMLNRAQFDTPIYIEANGGIIGGVNIQLANSFSLGISYGGQKILGKGRPDWYRIPGIQLKYRIFEEDHSKPAIAIGFDSQGFGEIGFDLVKQNETISSVDSYEFKSKGFYAVTSKNWELMGDFSFHLGINYSLEDDDDPKTHISGWLGFIKQINDVIYISGEYDLATNDKRKKDTNTGILNCGVKIRMVDSFIIQANFKDLLESKGDFQRSIFFTYIFTLTPEDFSIQ